jgi:two-component system copper resistance phosphate regulon response regulator CusR
MLSISGSSEQYGMLSRFLPVINKEFVQAAETAEETSIVAYRVLIMEKSVSLAKLLATGLQTESFAVDFVHDMESAALLVESRPYDLAILDLGLAETEGTELLQALRASSPDVRVLVLSGQKGMQDLVAAFELGVDDCLMKPFSLIELMARVRALRRRAASPIPQKPKSCKLVLHSSQCSVERDGRNIELTPREFALLEFLIENPGKTLSRSMLSQRVWNMPAEANTNIVDVYIKYLRDKLDGGFEDKLIRTVRGMGYLFQMNGLTESAPNLVSN